MLSSAPMLDFTNRKSKAPVAPFSLDRKDHLRRSQMRRREWRTALMLPIAILAVAIFIHFALQKTTAFGTVSTHQPLAAAPSLSPMPRPLFDQAPLLPDRAQIAVAAAATATAHEGTPWPEALGGTGAATLAYAQSQLSLDALAPPVPQRLGAGDLLLGTVRNGTPMALSGRLEDVQQGATGPYRRLLVALDQGQWAMVLSASDAPLTIGDQVQAVGRFLGREALPLAGGAQGRVPVMIARVVTPIEPGSPPDPKLLPEWSRGGTFVMPDNLFTDLDDERTYIESRPYYYLLNQTRLEATTPGVFDHPFDLNLHGDEVHQAPENYRDQIMKVRGVVYRSWEDADVAEDKPFGISRVVRALIYRNDFGPISETIDGVPVRRNRLVERLFEVAMVTDQPLPKVGDDITVTGHFLKFHAIPVTPNALRDRVHDVERQSGNVYTYFLVTGPYRIIAPADAYSFSGLEIAIVAMVIGALVLYWALSRKERTASDVVQAQVRRIRRSRQDLLQKRAPEAVPSGGPLPEAGAAASAPAPAPKPAPESPPEAQAPATPPAVPPDHTPPE